MEFPADGHISLLLYSEFSWRSYVPPLAPSAAQTTLLEGAIREVLRVGLFSPRAAGFGGCRGHGNVLRVPPLPEETTTAG